MDHAYRDDTVFDTAPMQWMITGEPEAAPDLKMLRLMISGEFVACPVKAGTIHTTRLPVFDTGSMQWMITGEPTADPDLKTLRAMIRGEPVAYPIKAGTTYFRYYANPAQFRERYARL